MRYTDNLAPLQAPATKPQAQPTLLDMANQLIRMETRLVKLMYHVGLDANGRVREEH